MRAGTRIRRKKGSLGFTLVEVLLAVFIMALTAMILCAAFPTSQISRIKAAHITYAVNLAHQTMEEKRPAGYSSLIAGTTETSIPPDLPGGEMTTTITQYSAHLKKIEVTITWTGYRRVGGSTSVITLVADHG